jgi:Domain of unknown function (DUF4307)
MSTFEDDEDDAPRRPRSRAWVWGWAGVGVLVLIAAWFGWNAAQQPVRWKDVGFTIDSDTQATATYDVYLYKDTGATCVLRALNDRFAEVGIAEVTIDRADGAEQRLSSTIQTTERATTAVVKYCLPQG